MREIDYFVRELPILLTLTRYEWVVSKTRSKDGVTFFNSHGRLIGTADFSDGVPVVPKGTKKILIPSA